MKWGATVRVFVVNPTILDGRYRLVKTAGTGGTANVYLAESTTTGEKVAVKVLKKALVQQDDMLGRFQREAKLLQAVSHPNIVKLIEFVDAPEGWLLLMQWAEGERLDRLTLTPEETKTVLAQLASALAAVHAAGIVHRDLKPALCRAHRARRPGEEALVAVRLTVD
jgi:serine/threonine protein kinase